MRGTGHRTEDSARLYNLDAWAQGFFAVRPDGRLAVTPASGEPVALDAIIQQARAQGLKTPLLLRFPHILRQRADMLCAAFDGAIATEGYTGAYTPVYPIKVNQQGSVVSALLEHPRLGLEAGSKPELLAVLGLLPEGRPIICNGYKDRAYIRLAMIAEQMGHPTTLVIEKMSEIPRIAEVAAEMGVRPRLGLRVRLASVSKGHWQNTGGEKSKFGLAAPQVLEAIRQLQASALLDCLGLIHCHLGSQIANLRDIRTGLREVGRFFVELTRAGAPIQVVDVGGGLGVDYDGTRSRASCSMNYQLADYAAAVVTTLAHAAEQAGLAAPDIVSESGRALTAHHAVLVTDVSDSEGPVLPEPWVPGPDAPLVLQELAGLLEVPVQPLECLEEGRVMIDQVQSGFARGDYSLQERADAENLWLQLLFTIRKRLDPNSRSQREALDELREKLADKLFCNFSLFQSLPDAWAIDQVFPIMPLQRLDERPTRMGLIRDLTCDSDGRVDMYVDSDGLESTLPIHDIATGEDYLLGFFMVGAYQEILGDMHNLFGDTDVANIDVEHDGSFQLQDIEHGDRAEELLEYVHIPAASLRAAYRRKITAAGLPAPQGTRMLDALEEALTSTTYLS